MANLITANGKTETFEEDDLTFEKARFIKKARKERCCAFGCAIPAGSSYVDVGASVMDCGFFQTYHFALCATHWGDNASESLAEDEDAWLERVLSAGREGPDTDLG